MLVRATFITLGFAAALSGCGSSDDAARAGPPPVPCSFDEDCAEGELCTTAGVREVALEPGETGTCTPTQDVIGSSPAPWSFRAGGSPLADRLCTAQGLSPGATAEADAIRARQSELLAATGVRVIRLDLTWSRIEPQQSAFDFAEFDPMIDAANAAGLEVLGILAYGVPWATSSTSTDDKYPPDDPGDYASYARAVAQHYSGKIRHYELWNEPNGGFRFFRPNLNGDAAAYAKLVVAASASIREVCSDCTIASAGLFFHSQVVNGAIEFSHDMLTAEPHALDGVDAFGIHPYPSYPPSTAPEDDTEPGRALGGMVDDIEKVLALHHVPKLPLAATELGWPSYGDVDEATQARFLSREILLGAALGLDPMCWFTLADGPLHGSSPPEDDFGLYHYGSEDPASTVSPKLARDALAWLANIGQGAVPAGANDSAELHDPAAGRFALDFDAPAGRWTAVWQTAGERTLHLAGESRKALDLTGELVASPSAGALDVTVSAAPIFLVP